MQVQPGEINIVNNSSKTELTTNKSIHRHEEKNDSDSEENSLNSFSDTPSRRNLEREFLGENQDQVSSDSSTEERVINQLPDIVE